MGKIIIKNAVKREPNKFYFVNGNGDLCEAVRGNMKSKKKPAKKKVTKKKGRK
jgi:hypothetical protein